MIQHERAVNFDFHTGGDAWAAACGAFAAWSAVAKAWPSTQVCRDTVVRLRAAPRAYATLTPRRREPPQVTDTSASLFYVEVMRDLIAKGLPGGFDACDAALYADEPKLMHKYTRGDGGVVYEYYARENAQSETVCGAHEACLLYTSPSPRDKRQSRMPSSA